ncbi:hypothetical protein [Symbiopectobacterium sp. RP]|uniref:hypothetical protein n=1 Tax=Symbiopectobacterium sp. RP TaxID=3248553 RepID=UPI003D28BAB2
MGTSKKQKKREWLRYRDFVLSPYGVIKIKSLGYSRYCKRCVDTYARCGWELLANLVYGDRLRSALMLRESVLHP